MHVTMENKQHIGVAIKNLVEQTVHLFMDLLDLKINANTQTKSNKHYKVGEMEITKRRKKLLLNKKERKWERSWRKGVGERFD